MEGDTAAPNGGQQQHGHGPHVAVANHDTNTTQAHAPIAADSEYLQVNDRKTSVEDGGEHSSTATSHLPSPRLTATDLAARAVHDMNTDMTSATNGSDPLNDRLTPVKETLPYATPTEPFVPFVHLPTPEPDPQPTAPAQPLSPSCSKTRSRSGTKTGAHDGVRRLSASKIQELTNAPESLPIATAPDRQQPVEPTFSPTLAEVSSRLQSQLGIANGNGPNTSSTRSHPQQWPTIAPRTVSTPPVSRRLTATAAPQQARPSQEASIRRNSYQPNPRPPPLDLDGTSNFNPGAAEPRAAPPPRQQPEPDAAPPSPIPQNIPLPPMSVPTLLQLELAGSRPSPLYIHHSYTSDIPYESSAIKFERLKNFLVVPFVLERSITFGALACLDAWLWTFTILPMRFGIAVSILLQWWGYVIAKETRWVVGFVWYGLGRMWRRGRRGRSESVASTDGQRSRSQSRVRDQPVNNSTSATTTGADTGHPNLNLRMAPGTKPAGPSRRGRGFGHRRTKSNPSNLTHYNKADLLQGAVVIVSSIALMSLDASRMYHSIRAQSAIKLYTIYNLLEVGDRLLSALGQDIFECLFSNETLSRDSLGRSKVLLPLGIFCLALVYNILHAVILFYQVIALNVAVNSYSNTLLTLLMSNQFVEIKSAVFKRFEKENTFQMACADIVERFQLWIMLLIIAMRNVVEVGGLSVPGAGSEDSGPSSFPLHTASILPASFTILPSWLWSGEVLSPFVVVIGSEMVVDWIKHAYVNKFNNIKPNFYSRILDILCKDYYTNAFVTPQLTRRLGLPLLPLSCLFIRASFQIYNMFVAVHVPTPLPPSTQTSLSVDSATPSPAMLAALDRLDKKIRIALGRAVYGSYPFGESDGGGLADNISSNSNSFPTEDMPEPAGLATHIWSSISQYLPEWKWTSDDVIAFFTMITVFLLIFLVLLIFKLLLGMLLLRYSRDRYARMKAKEAAIAAGQAEKESYETKGKRVGGYGQVEVGEERRRWIFADDPKGLNKVREREKGGGGGGGKGGGGKQEKDLNTVMRYEMIAKRIW